MNERVWELRVTGGEHGSSAIYYHDRKPTAAECEMMQAYTSGDRYELRPVTRDGQSITPLPRTSRAAR